MNMSVEMKMADVSASMEWKMEAAQTSFSSAISSGVTGGLLR